jgi:DNA-binding NarL/FixJ family response regulator
MLKPENSIRILIADSQFLITESLKYLLHREGKYSVNSVNPEKEEIIRFLTNENIDLLIIDPFISDFTEISDLKSIAVNFVSLKIIVLVNSITRKDLHELNSIGITNIILKSAGRQDIFDVINSALTGKKYYSNELLDLVFDQNIRNQLNPETGQLTASEIEIVRLIADGLTTKEIALKKFISPHTVISHRKNIFRKLGVSSVSELLILAIRSGWINLIEYHI